MQLELVLPSGATVKFRDPKTLKVSDRKKLIADMTDEQTISAGMAMLERLAGLLVIEWSLDLVIPSVRLEILDELSLEDYDVLTETVSEALPVLWPRLSKTEETMADPKALTDNFNG